MKIREVQFIQSSSGLKDMPVFEQPEFAFIGRSNVGKSSLINMLCGRKGIAKVSGTPGKTRLINHFKVTSDHRPATASRQPLPKRGGATTSVITSHWYLVDLPGYGWAKQSKELREKFEGTIRNYLYRRENLSCTFVLIDSRLPAQKNDLEFLDWLGNEEISFIILFTKVDKLSKTQLNSNLKSYRKVLAENWEEIPLMIPVSSVTGQGKDDLLSAIQNMLTEIAG